MNKHLIAKFPTEVFGCPDLALGGAEVDTCPTEVEFVVNIIKKGIQDRLLRKEDFLKFL
jgi:hypothetical protein